MIGTAVDLDALLSEAGPESLTPLDVAQAAVDLADLCGRLETLAERLANAAEPLAGPQADPRAVAAPVNAPGAG
jgi:hypothetical protein